VVSVVVVWVFSLSTFAAAMLNWFPPNNVMCGIGAGKTSVRRRINVPKTLLSHDYFLQFIKPLKDNAGIRDDFKSETSDVQVIRFVDRPSGRKVSIVDTPGFDESHSAITNTDMLKIADYLHKECVYPSNLCPLLFILMVIQGMTNTES